MHWWVNNNGSPFNIPKLNPFFMLKTIRKFKFCNIFHELTSADNEHIGYITGYTPTKPVLADESSLKLSVISMECSVKEGLHHTHENIYTKEERSKFSKHHALSYEDIKDIFPYNPSPVIGDDAFGFIQYIECSNSDTEHYYDWLLDTYFEIASIVYPVFYIAPDAKPIRPLLDKHAFSEVATIVGMDPSVPLLPSSVFMHTSDVFAAA
jgi:hypothetical protein